MPAEVSLNDVVLKALQGVRRTMRQHAPHPAGAAMHHAPCTMLPPRFSMPGSMPGCVAAVLGPGLAVPCAGSRHAHASCQRGGVLSSRHSHLDAAESPPPPVHPDELCT